MTGDRPILRVFGIGPFLACVADWIKILHDNYFGLKLNANL